MCQLNLIRTDHEQYKAFNQIILASQLITNSRKLNKDGYGIYSEEHLFKFHLFMCFTKIFLIVAFWNDI